MHQAVWYLKLRVDTTRITPVSTCPLLFLAPLNTSGSPELSEAIRLSYSFQFEVAVQILETLRQQQPSDPESHIGQIIVDFLQLQQDPRPVISQAVMAISREQETWLPSSKEAKLVQSVIFSSSLSSIIT